MKRLRRGWKHTTRLVNMGEYPLYHAPSAVYILDFRLDYLAELGVHCDAYEAVRNVPPEIYQEALRKIRQRKELDIYRKRANKDIDAALKESVTTNKKLRGSQD